MLLYILYRLVKFTGTGRIHKITGDFTEKYCLITKGNFRIHEITRDFPENSLINWRFS